MDFSVSRKYYKISKILEINIKLSYILLLNLIFFSVSKPESDEDVENEEKENEYVPEDNQNRSNAFLNSIKTDLSNNTSLVEHTNYPCICEKFLDPFTGNEKVLVVVNIPSGAQNVEIDICSDGDHITLSYYWAKLMYSAEDLFKADLQSEKPYHPKILAVLNGLERIRLQIEEVPKSIMRIKLPIKIQTSQDSWIKKEIQGKDATQVVIAEFQGFKKTYFKKKTETLVKFESETSAPN